MQAARGGGSEGTPTPSRRPPRRQSTILDEKEVAMGPEDCRILVTPASYGTFGSDLRRRLEESCKEAVFYAGDRPLTEGELREALRGIDGYIAGLDEVTAVALEGADRLKVISRYGVGVDNVDLEAAARRGITVTNTPGANSVSVAELTIGFILSLLRRLPEAVTSTREGTWPRMSGLGLRGKRVGIIGFGAIGSAVARRLLAFDCRLLAHDPYQPSLLHGVERTSLAELVSSADIVSLHVPSTEETRGMVNEGFLSSMKQGAFLVNTARGDLVEEEALLGAIRDGRIAGAALDVFAGEPLPAKSPLLAEPRILVTPHMAAHSDDAIHAMGEMATADCLAVLRGAPPAHPVTAAPASRTGAHRRAAGEGSP